MLDFFFVVKDKNVIAILIDKNLQPNFSSCVQKRIPLFCAGFLRNKLDVFRFLDGDWEERRFQFQANRAMV